MRYRNLGRTGVKVSELCLGTMTFGWTADETTSHAIMDHAWEAGMNFFDTADIYSNWAENSYAGKSEEIIGRWLAHKGRDQLVIATKVRGSVGDGPNDSGLGRKHIMDGVDNSLRRLGTDYIDLYQTHWPDLETPLEETLETLNDLVRAGKVRYIGCSNHPAWYLTKALWLSDKHNWARYDTLQPHYNLVNRAEVERELKSLCQDQGIGVIPYSPLAGGFLTGKYHWGQDAPQGSRGAQSKPIQKYMANERNWELLRKLEETGKRYDKSVGQVALAWLRDEPVVTAPIIGANTVEQLQDTLGVVGFSLTDEERQEIALASAWQD